MIRSGAVAVRSERQHIGHGGLNRKDSMVRIPSHEAPAHPGEILLEKYLKALGMTQVALAERIEVPLNRVNEIVKGKRSVTPDTAMRLERLFGASAQSWLNAQLAWDLYHAQHSPAAKQLDRIRPLTTKERQKA